MDASHFHPTSTRDSVKAFKNSNQFITELSSAINDEASAIKFYAILEGMAPRSYRDFVTHAKNDEMTHLYMFRKLYFRLTGREPSVHADVTEFSTYKEGIEIAFRRELEAAERYRDMYLNTRVPKIRDILFKAMTDEMEHATRFNFLYFLSSDLKQGR